MLNLNNLQESSSIIRVHIFIVKYLPYYEISKKSDFQQKTTVYRLSNLYNFRNLFVGKHHIKTRLKIIFLKLINFKSVIP